jgi:hypothetical protein
MHACDQDATLEPEVEQALTCLFEKEIAFNRVFEELKQRMASTKTFSLQLAFSLIDDWQYGYVDRKNLKSFFRKHQHVASSLECACIIRRLDLDADARLSLTEFVEGLHPCDPYSKSIKRVEMTARTHPQDKCLPL